MNRRDFLGGVAVLGLPGCGIKAKTASTPPASAPPALPPYDVLPKLMPIRAHVDRIFRVTACLRPFRAAGPRLDVERVGDKIVVHNYGHGGSGWSLSWGSSSIAVEKAMSAGERDVAVIGCGAVTHAHLLSRRALSDQSVLGPFQPFQVVAFLLAISIRSMLEPRCCQEELSNLAN